MSSTLLPLVVLIPLLGAALAVTSARAAAATAVLTALALIATVARLALDVARHGVLLHQPGGWPAPIGIELRADGLAALLLATSAVVGVCITVYATAYFRPASTHEKDRGVRFFWPLWLMIWSALNATFITTDLFNLYVCLELITLPAVALVALDGTRPAIAAALRYLLLSLGGSLLYLLGVAVVYTGAGTLALPLLAANPLTGDSAALALSLMTAGLAIKAALWPMHFWLPPAHDVAPAPASALLSALVVKAAFVIVVRLWIEAFPAAVYTLGVAVPGALGAAAVLWGSLLALRQTRVKLIIACSTVAQIGYLFMVLPLLRDAPAAWSGGVYHLISHALAKAALFLAAGSMIRALGADDLDAIAGVGQKLPLTFAAFGIAGLSLAGLPPSGGFVAKWLLLSAALSAGQWWWAVAMVAGSLLAAAYVLRVLQAAFTQPRATPLRNQPPAVMTGAALALALLSMLLGIWSEPPLALLDVSLPAAVR